MSETPAIAAEGLVRNYGKTKALAGFDLTVPPGMVSPGPVTVTLRVSKPKPPDPQGDARELGAVIEGFGFK